MSLLFDDHVDFDEAEHKYSIEGIEVPSVTTILKDPRFMKNIGFYTPDGANRGTYIHKLTEQYDNGTMDWGSVVVYNKDGEIEADYTPYLEAYIMAKSELGLKPIEREVKMVNREMWYAGTGDFLGWCNREETVPWVIDLKSGVNEKWHSLQLILYGGMVKWQMDNGVEIPLKMADLYLQKNGKYKFVECDNSQMNQKAAFGAVPGYHFWRAL